MRKRTRGGDYGTERKFPGLNFMSCRYDYGAGQFRTWKESRVRLHPSSALAAYNKRGKDLPSGGWLVFNEMTRAGRTAYLRGVSSVSSLTVALMCGPSRLPAATWLAFYYVFLCPPEWSSTFLPICLVLATPPPPMILREDDV